MSRLSGVGRTFPLAPVFLLAVVAVAGGVLPAAAADEEGGAAPAGRWLMHGGAAARTGLSRSAPFTDRVRHAWTYLPGRPIVGEPRVWDEAVVLEVEETPDRRSLHLVGLADGRLIRKTVGYKTPLPLAPCLGHSMVVARTAPRVLTVFRIEPRRLKRLWSVREKEPFGEPLMIGREIYHHNGKVLRRYRIARKSPLWELRGAFHGRLALRGPDLYVLEYDDEDKAHLLLVDRETGQVRERERVAYHGGKRPSADERAEIHVGRRRVIVRTGLPIRLHPDRKGATGVVLRRLRRGREQRVVVRLENLSWMRGDPAMTPAGVIGLHDDGEGRRAWVVTEGKGERNGLILASKGAHRALLDVEHPPTAVGRVCYLGPVAFDVESLKVLWRRRQERSGRAIPARGTLLRVEHGSRLVALKQVRTGGGVKPDEVPEACEGGEAFLRDGSRSTGTFEILPGERPRLVRTGPDQELRSWALSEVLLVLDAEGRPYWRGGEGDVIKLVDRGVDDRLASGYEALLGRACATNDGKLIGRLLREALMRGASTQAIRKAERKLDMLKTKSPRVKRSLVAEVRDEERVMLDRALDPVVRRAGKLDRPADATIRLNFLRAVLLRSPNHAGAVAAVRESVPAGMTPTEPIRALDWVDFLSAIAVIPVEVVGPPAAGEEPTREQRALLEGQKRWRKDLIGIQSERLFILTGLDSPGRVARCLSLGELLCDHLDGRYAKIGQRRKTLNRLHIQLFESQAEYVKQCGGNDKTTEAHLKWTGGHYSPRLRLARVYIPKGADGFEKVLSVFAHELTHQWMDERCPAFAKDEWFLELEDRPGYWYVEGIATMMEDARYDLSRRSVSVDPAASEYVDLLASLVEANARLVPWKTLFARAHIGVISTDPRPIPQLTVASYWRLGAINRLSAVNLFYIQAAAATHFLMHAEDGKYRERFLRSVAEFHSGRWRDLTVEKAYGITAERLGQRIVKFARKLRAEAAAGR